MRVCVCVPVRAWQLQEFMQDLKGLWEKNTDEDPLMFSEELLLQPRVPEKREQRLIV